MTILFANFLVYLLWLVWAMKKNKWHIDVFCLVLSFYVLISFLGFFTCVMGIYQNTFGNKDWENLSVVPYVMALMCTFLFLIPLRSWKISQIIPDVSPYVSFFSRVSFVLLFIFAAQAVLSMMNANVSNLDYADVYNDAAAGTATSFKSGVTNFVYSKVIALARVGAPFFYIFQCLLLVQTKKIKHIIMILVAYLLLLVPLILTANRGGMFFSTADIIFFVVLFWPNISKKMKRVFFVCLIGIFVVMSSFAIAISSARFDQMKMTNGTEQIFRYFGEAYPNLGFNIWGKNIKHPYGSRMFPNYSALFTGVNLSKNYKSGRNASFYYWERYVGIPMLNFKTLFGDLYIEFGVVGTWFVALLWLLLLRILKKRRGIIGSIIVVFFAYQTCIWGLFGSNLSEQYLTTILYTVILLWLWKKTNLGKIRPDDKKVLI